MTEADDRMDDPTLRPAYRRRSDAPGAPPEPPAQPAEVAKPEPERSDDEDADLERGRTLAVVAAMGRLQMSIDVLARQQKKHAETVEARLARIERALSERR